MWRRGIKEAYSLSSPPLSTRIETILRLVNRYILKGKSPKAMPQSNALMTRRKFVYRL
jgi:hypothetical protein